MAVPRAKKSKPKQVTLKEKDIESMKLQLTKEITNKAILLTICAIRDELKVSDTKIFKCAERVDRYASALDTHLVKINNFSKSLKDNTGIDWGIM